MIDKRGVRAALAAAMLLAAGACAAKGGTAAQDAQNAAAKLVVTVHTRQGPRVFNAEVARTSAEQERGMMFRTNLPADFGMIFTPYPGDGGPPREARFWMKNTPTSLDIIFIRPDGTIAAIAENTVPFSEETSRSGEPVSAVFEILAGKSAELGIAPGDKVSWPGQKR